MKEKKKGTSQGTKKRKRVYLTELQWIEVRTLWESSDQYTFKTLSTMFGVSINTLKHRSSKECWSRKAITEEVQGKIRENTIESLARLGLPKDEWLKMVIEGARETKCLKNIKSMAKDENGKLLRGKDNKPIVFDQTISAIDNETTYKYREMICKIAGWYHAPKASVVSNDGSEEEEVIPVVSHMTPVKKEENE